MATTISAGPMAYTTPPQAQFTAPPRTYWQDSWARFRRDRLAIVGGIIFALFCLLALFAPWISANVTGYDPNRIDLRATYAVPSPNHWFGADEYGRDYFTRAVYAGQISLGIGFLYAAVTLSVGVVAGLAAGYYGGIFDDLLQAIINIVSALPLLPLLIVINAFLGTDWIGLALILATLGWPAASRQVRGLVLSIRERDYILAARTVGVSDARIMFQHILPNVFSIVLVMLGFDVAGAILAESGLSFLGFGVKAPTATWGNMLTNSIAYTTKDPWLVLFPGLLISLTVLSVFLLADGLRDAMDPRLRY
jgi:ABC-type dipeptide/oligopeptide/nickel transport system permease subunit